MSTNENRTTMEGGHMSSYPYGAYTYQPPPQTQPPIPYHHYYSQPPPYYWQPPIYPQYSTESYPPPPQYPEFPTHQSPPPQPQNLDEMQCGIPIQMVDDTRMTKMDSVLERLTDLYTKQEDANQQVLVALRAVENSLLQISEELAQSNLGKLPSASIVNPKDTEHCKAEEKPKGMVLEELEQSLEQKADSDMPATENNKAGHQEAVTEHKDQPPLNAEEIRDCKSVNVRMREVLKNVVGEESNQTGKPAGRDKNVRMGETRARTRWQVEDDAGERSRNKDVAADLFHCNKKNMGKAMCQDSVNK